MTDPIRPRTPSSASGTSDPAGAAPDGPSPPERPDARPDAEIARVDDARTRSAQLRRAGRRSRVQQRELPTPRTRDEVGVYVRSFHHLPLFGGGFHGDGRSFSADLSDTARIHSGAVLRRGEEGLALARSGGRSSPTSHAVGGLATSSPRLDASARPSADGFTELQLDYAGSNPLLPGAPDIDVHAQIGLREDGERLHVRMKVDGDRFPNAEAFLRDHEGNAVFLGVHSLRPGQSPGDLVGDRRAPMMENELTVLRGDRGQFVGVEFDGVTYDLESWNRLFETAPGESWMLHEDQPSEALRD